MDWRDRRVGKTARPKKFQLCVGLSRGGTTNLEQVPVPLCSPSSSRHHQFPPLLTLCSMNLGCLPLHDFAASTPETRRGLQFLCRFVNCFKQEMTLCLENPPSTCNNLGGAAVCATLRSGLSPRAGLSLSVP